MVKKRNGALFLLLLLAVLMPMGSFAAAPVVDDANLFTSTEIAQMEALIQTIQSTYQMDAVVVTSQHVPTDGSQAYADDFYDYNGYGLGEDHAGILYLIDLSNRVPHISTAGVMIDYMTDHRINDLLDTVDAYLQRGRYGDSAIALLKQVTTFLQEGREKGSFRYDAETGERLTGLYNPLTTMEMGIAVAAGLLVCWLVVSAVRGRYLLKGTTYRYNANVNTGLDVTHTRDHYLRESRRTVRRTQPSGGGGFGGSSSGGSSGMGSRTHTSSSGRSHGGGTGRKF